MDGSYRFAARGRRRAARGLLLILTLGLMTMLTLQSLSAQQPVETERRAVNLDRDNVVYYLIVPTIAEYFQRDLSPTLSDAPLVFHQMTIMMTAAFDAIAPYHPTAVGAYSRFGRQPASELTTRNVNIAALYAVYRSGLALAPKHRDLWRGMLTGVGLDPDDGSENLGTPQGLGNMAAKMVLAARRHDGMNAFGDLTNGRRYFDPTGYQPMNTVFELIDPSRWQPLVVQHGTGRYTVQRHATPQWANTAPFSNLNPRDVRMPAPTASYIANSLRYRYQAERVLKMSSDLTDEEKMLIEFFDNKLRDVLQIENPFKLSPTLSTAEDVRIHFLLNMAGHDAGIIAWQEKMRYDAVRPATVIRYLFNEEMVRSWTPDRGYVDVPGSQWQSYIETFEHSEYPSGTVCTCAAYAEAMRLLTGTDQVEGYSGVIAAGSSRREPGVTPAVDLRISFDSWTEHAQDCALSRVLGGVHFMPAVEEPLKYCPAAGSAAYEYYASLIDGTAPARGPSIALAPDPLLRTTSWAPLPEGYVVHAGLTP